MEHLIKGDVPSDSRQLFAEYCRQLQDTICKGLEDVDGKSKFIEDIWHKEPAGSGGGRTRVIKDGNVFEQGGVNWSEVTSHQLPPTILSKMPHLKGQPFYATGISIVIHPISPLIPTIHMNYRYFEAGTGDQKVFWFGGGTDLTPYYPNYEQFLFFHKSLKDAADPHGEYLYPTFKLWCDEYFYIKHRQECRGIGGIFFDYQDGDPNKLLYMGPDPSCSAAQYANAIGNHGKQRMTWKQLFAFVQSMGNAFLPTYSSIVESIKREHGLTFTQTQREWQLYRRGRYVEFNLVYDRGTLFGLQTPGSRIESILMSLPPMVRFEYCYEPKEGSPEHDLRKVLLNPKDWLECCSKPT